ncbi:MAG: hypothetical protein JRE23_08715 [Deltaproteobacteria bacterium]|nr:hypothetical protein [Deltaproteobacteria bacterium]
MPVVQRIRRVWCDEPEYDERTDIDPEFDEDSEEWFRVIIDETDDALEERLSWAWREKVVGQINEVRTQLDTLENQLSIFNTKGLKILTANLDNLNIAMFSITLDSNDGE